MRERTSARHAHHRRKSRAVYAVMLLGISLFIGLVATNSRSSSDTNTNRTSATTFSFAETNPDANSSSLELVDTAAAASSVSLADKPFHIRDVPGGGSDAPTTVQFRGAVYTRNDVPVAEHLLPAYTRAWWIDLVGTLVCILIAALAAGLTVGLVSIDPFDLAVIQTTEEADCSTAEEIAELREEKVYADKLMPLVQRHHLLLVTLLIMNSFANEVLPLLLDNLVPSWLAIVLSVSAVLLFGEILPSSIFTGPKQLRLAASLVPLVWCFVCFLFVLAWPIAWVLDHTLGVEDESRLRRSELKSLIRLQANRPSSTSPREASHGDEFAAGGEVMSVEEQHQKGLLSLDEMTILHGVLEMKDRTVKDAMVGLDEVFMLPLSTVLDLNQMAYILHQGHSRIPIFDGRRSNIRGVLLVKRLIVVNPEDRRPLRTIATRWPLLCSPDLPLLDCLNLFQTGRSHMAIVCTDPSSMMIALRAEQPLPEGVDVLGIVTLEDIIEQLIKEEISDETDLGVRSVMEHSAFVRKRIERLKALAAKESAGPQPVKATSRHMRAPSTIASRVLTTTAIAAATTAGVRITQTPGTPVLGPSGSPSLSAAPTPKRAPSTSNFALAGESTPITRAVSTANILSYQSVASSSAAEVRVRVDSFDQMVLPPTRSASDTVRDALPRDDLFTRAARIAKEPRSSSSVSSTSAPAPAAAPSYALPPHHHTPVSVVAPSSTRASGSSILTPRATFSADALMRKDLDLPTITELKHAKEATAAHEQEQQASASGRAHLLEHEQPSAANDAATLGNSSYQQDDECEALLSPDRRDSM